MTHKIVAKALAYWGMPKANYTLAAKRENTVFQVTTAQNEFALRLHRIGYRTQAELESELQWMSALAEAGIRVPRPIPSESGHLIHEIDGILIDILEWLPGTQVGVAGTLPNTVSRVDFCKTLGQSMAQLHNISDKWTPAEAFIRPAWNRAGLVGPTPLWGPFWENPMLSATERDTLLAVKSATDAQLEALEPSLDYGLIHADLLSENMILHESSLYMIDFDDSGYGFRDFELATFLLRFLDAPDYPTLAESLIAGYSARRAVTQENLQLFLLLRALTYVGWIVPRMDLKNGAEKSATAIKRAVALGKKYLS